ncbi:tripartite tricarboxylate transporter substrate-binding protein [Corticibacterium sp. UT-5YL-CI-8]|nr:tripartite tricarboxylate transporter substrate-binding protein [Tianweitania sp. UT-5YL-CI-8]
MQTRLKRYVAGLAVLALSIGMVGSSFAQAYPQRPVTVIVPTGPGSLADIVMRYLATGMEAKWGQQIIVENVPGAGGTIGVAKLAAASPDGYTLGFVPANFTTHPHLFDTTYDVIEDFVPISQVVGAPTVLYANSALGFTNAADLIAFAKANPGQLSYASAGKGSITYLAAELLRGMTGAQFTEVPYADLRLASLDVISGRVGFTFLSIAQGEQYAANNKLVALGISSKLPNTSAPGVMPIADQGVPGYDISSWFGMIGPRGIPGDVVSKMNGAIVEITQTPEFADFAVKSGVDLIAGTPDEFGSALVDEVTKFGDLIGVARGQ